jgi:antitoxin CptB
MDPSDAQTQARRLLWRCRRGMKELDVLLERFARERYESASADEKRAFARLLDLPDPELAGYVFGHATPAEPDLAHLARLIANRQS